MKNSAEGATILTEIIWNVIKYTIILTVNYYVYLYYSKIVAKSPQFVFSQWDKYIFRHFRETVFTNG